MKNHKKLDAITSMEQLKAFKDKHCWSNLIKHHAMSVPCLMDLPKNQKPIIAPSPTHPEHQNIAFSTHSKFSGNNREEAKLGIMITLNICNGSSRGRAKEPNSSILKESQKC